MRLIKCMFCGKPTTYHQINAQKKISGKIVTVSKAPVFYCKPCNETFLAKESQDVFNYIRDNNLAERSILFNFDDIIKKIF